jgi:hypothetical protein
MNEKVNGQSALWFLMKLKGAFLLQLIAVSYTT